MLVKNMKSELQEGLYLWGARADGTSHPGYADGPSFVTSWQPAETVPENTVSQYW